MNARWPLRILHAVVVATTLIVVGVALYALTASIGLQSEDESTANVAGWICFALPWLVLLAAAWAIWKRLCYAIALPLLGVSSAFVFYLAWDDPSRPPAPKIAVLVPTDSKSYAVYQRFVKDPAGTATSDATMDPDFPIFPGDLADWPAFVVEHRAQIEEAWNRESFGQAWIQDMALNKPGGLYPPEAYNVPGLQFSKVRRAAQLRWAKFHLLVAEGHPDEAAQLLRPLLRANYHLQSAGTTLLNQMIAVVLLKGSYQRLELIAGAPALTPAARTELLAALNEAPAMTVVFHNAFLGEEFFARSAMEAIKGSPQKILGELAQTDAVFAIDRDWFPFLGTLPDRLLFNPNRTEREFSEFLKRSCELLQNRQFDQSSELAQAFDSHITTWHLKNPIGRLFSVMTLPAFQKVGHQFWLAEDQRVALIERLKPAH